MNYCALDIVPDKPKLRSFNARFIPKRLIELAKAGTYYDSRIIG